MRKPKIPDISQDSNYQLRIGGDQKEFFVRGSPRGFVIGPCTEKLKAGRDDHLTVGINEQGEFTQIHRTLDNCKVWWRTPESIQTEFHRFWLTHSEEIDEGLLTQSGTYIISMNRMNVALSVLTSFTSVGMNLLARYVQKYDIIQLDDKSIRIAFGMDKSKALRLGRVLAIPLLLLSVVLRLLPKVLLLRVLKGSFKFFLIRPTNIRKRLKADIGILIARDRLGLIRLNKQGGVSFIPFSAIGELYNDIERNLPLGKLSELGNFGEEATLALSVKPKRE